MGECFFQAGEQGVFQLMRNGLGGFLGRGFRGNRDVHVAQLDKVLGVEDGLPGQQVVTDGTDGVQIAAGVDGVGRLDRFG